MHTTRAEPIWPADFSADTVRTAFGGGRLSSFCLALEAWRRGLEVTYTRADLHLFTLSDGERRISFDSSRPDSLTPAEDHARLDDKWESKRILAARGVPVPRAVLLTDAALTDDQVAAHAEDIGYPVVIKPASGSMGFGVSANIRSLPDLIRHYRDLVATYPDRSVIIEQHIEGDDYRVLVVGDRVVAATHRVTAHVVGDGRSTVDELLTRKTALRKRNPYLSSGPVPRDAGTDSLLEEQGLQWSSVPEAGRTVQLARNASSSLGGDTIDVTDSLPDSMRRAAVDALAAMPNCHIAGIDFIHDGAGTGEFAILEMNSRPHIPLNMYTTHGRGADVPKAMIDHFFPNRPRRGRPGDSTLTLALDTVQQTLLARRASAVTLAPLPEHGLPVRLEWTLPQGRTTTLRRVTRRKVLWRSAAHGVSGVLRCPKDGPATVVVAGEDVGTCRGFMDELFELLREPMGLPSGAALAEPAHWNGRLSVGFAVL